MFTETRLPSGEPVLVESRVRLATPLRRASASVVRIFTPSGPLGFEDLNDDDRFHVASCVLDHAEALSVEVA